MHNSKKKIHFLHYPNLHSTNQKLYQLAEMHAADWTVVSCDNQTSGKGYSGNQWQSNAYENVTFSLLLRDTFHIETDLPYLNMWISMALVDFLTNWQIACQVKWPNDIILNNKKLAGILIENKIQGSYTKFTVVGIGLNVLQTDFGSLKTATSLQKEFPEKDFEPETFIRMLVSYFLKNYDVMMHEAYSEILKKYNTLLFKKNQIAVYMLEGKQYNGILKKVDKNGNAVIELEDLGVKTFHHKEIHLLY